NQVQQADKQVVDVQVQTGCGHDVVGFATVNDTAGVVKDEARHQEYNRGTDGQAEGGDLYAEQAGDKGAQHAHDNHHQACNQHAAHEAEVLLGGQDVARQPQEHHGCSAKRLHHNLTTVRKLQVVHQDRAEGQAQKAGESEYDTNAGAAVGSTREDKPDQSQSTKAAYEACAAAETNAHGNACHDGTEQKCHCQECV